MSAEVRTTTKSIGIPSLEMAHGARRWSVQVPGVLTDRVHLDRVSALCRARRLYEDGYREVCIVDEMTRERLRYADFVGGDE